ncbi:MAG: hypothetical protein ABIK49_04845 [candidate division WOR-3 bacterium]
MEKVVAQLLDERVLQERSNGIFFLTDALEHKVELGKIHSNIQEKSFGQYQVIDITSGQEIGTVYFVLERFVLAGRSWQTIERKERDKKILVKPLEAISTSTKVFEGTGTGGYCYLMAEVLKARIFPGLKKGEFPFYTDGDRSYIVHLLGTTYGGLLAAALQVEGKDAEDLGGKVLIISNHRGGGPPHRNMERFPLPTREAIKAVVRAHLEMFEDSLGSGAFFDLLPEELKVEDHLLTLDVDGLWEYLDAIQLVRMEPAALRAQIGEHLPEMVQE